MYHQVTVLAQVFLDFLFPSPSSCKSSKLHPVSAQS